MWRNLQWVVTSAVVLKVVSALDLDCKLDCFHNGRPDDNCGTCVGCTAGYSVESNCKDCVLNCDNGIADYTTSVDALVLMPEARHWVWRASLRSGIPSGCDK
jgi:hypothetical protein